MRRVLPLIILLAGCASQGDIPSRAAPSVVAGLSQPRRLTESEALYIRYCSGCHGWEGRGDGPIAKVLGVHPPSLRRSELYNRYTEAELTARVLFGEGFLTLPDAAKIIATEEEVSALVSYLKQMPRIDWDEFEQGRENYDSLCAFCHGTFGRGDGMFASAQAVPLPDLSASAYQSQARDEELFRIISEGKGKMPGAGNVLQTDDIRSVIAYLRELSPGYELYERFCAGCHGSDGEPPTDPQPGVFGVPPAPEEQLPKVVFDEDYFRTHTDTWVRAWVRHMVKENRSLMPHFSGDLGAGEIRAILSYLRTLPPES